MRRAFADSVYFIALLAPNDELHAQARAYDAADTSSQTITTDAVLVEVLAYFSKRGAGARRGAVELIDALRLDARADIVHQDEVLFFAGVDLYRRRLDKGYSLTDCMSMVVCRERKVAEVLSHDRHFSQEGFALLL